MAKVRRDTALQCVAAMAYEDAFSDLFTAFELLLLHSEAKKAGLLCFLVPYRPLANYIFGQPNRHLFAVLSLDARINTKSCAEDVLLKS